MLTNIFFPYPFYCRMFSSHAMRFFILWKMIVVVQHWGHWWRKVVALEKGVLATMAGVCMFFSQQPYFLLRPRIRRRHTFRPRNRLTLRLRTDSGALSVLETDYGSHSVLWTNFGSHSVHGTNFGSHYVPGTNSGSHSVFGTDAGLQRPRKWLCPL